MPIPIPEQELGGSKVNAVAERIWREALAQPEFAEVTVIWCYSASSASDHRNGRCCDFMVTYSKSKLTRAQQVAMGDRIRSYFVKHAARLRVQGIIWNHHVTGFPIEGGTSSPDVTYRGPAGQARAYSGGDQHTDHVHVQIAGTSVRSWLDAPKPPASVPASPASDKPEGSTGYPAPTDCVVYADKVKPGVTDSDSVYWVQRWLNSVPLPAAPLLQLTGDYDTPTGVAARAFQASLSDAPDGDLGPKQTLALYGQASAHNPDLPKPTFIDPEQTGADMPKLVATLDVPGAGIWQGALQDQSGYWLLIEAFTEGDCWIHRLAADGTYRDKMVLKVAAGYKVHPTGWALDNGSVWVTWNSVSNDVVRFPYKAGATIEKKDATPVHVFTEGNTQVALSPGRDFAVLRRLRTDTETYVRRAKQALLEGRDEPIGKPVLVKRNNAKRTVQGFTVVDDVLAIITGRPSTGEPTLVSRYSFTTGKPLDVQTIALPGEPEGIDGKRVAIKQNTGAARRLKIYELR